MPIAIHHRPGSFSDRWIEYCKTNNEAYSLVNCYTSNIIDKLRGFSALLWHINHGEAADMLMARNVLNAAELQGLVVYPNWGTQWHFDDKVAQKYMLEAIGAPLSPSHAFFDLKSANEWIDTTSFPKVFKLRRGSGSRNVRLVRSAAEARQLASKAFRSGYRASGALLGGVTSWKVHKARQEGRLWQFLCGLPGKLRRRLTLDFFMGREKGYVYFQDFVADNRFDTRVTIIGNRAFVFHRYVRAGDFRASGSGQIVYGSESTDPECIRTAFGIANHLGSQSMAFDFVHDSSQRPLILEISFGFASKPVFDCGGYWDPNLKWHASPTWPEYAILEDVLSAIRINSSVSRLQL